MSQESPSVTEMEGLQKKLAELLNYNNEDEQLLELEEERRRLIDEGEGFDSTDVASLEEDPDILKKKRELEEYQREVERSKIAHEGRRREIERIRVQGDPEELEKRKKELKERLEMTQKGLDLCILMDATGSMRLYIEQCQLTILKLFEEAKKISGGVVRISFIAYRDYCDEVQFEWRDFEENGGNLNECVKKVKAKGGGDTPEDIAGAFKYVEKLSWKSNVRLIFHVADAACHGKKYHSYTRDDHEEGDPNGYNPEESMKFFAKNSIDYYFLRLRSGTDKMCDILKEAYREQVGEVGIFRVVENGADLDPTKFLPSVIQSLTASCRRF